MAEKEQETIRFGQTLGEGDFASAWRALNHCASPWRRRMVRAGVCATAALAVALFLPVYRRHFASAVLPAVLICAFVVAAAAFFFLQPVTEGRRSQKAYRSCGLLAQPSQFCIRQDRAEWKSRYESCTEYWTDFLFCAETPTLFVAAGGFQRGILVMKKSGLAEGERKRLALLLSGAFAGRYYVLKRDV